MSLDEKFIPVRNAFYDIVKHFFETLATRFGYPENPGMPTIPDVTTRSEFLSSLPRHKTFWPPAQRPETWFEMIFGTYPKLEPVERYLYESKEEGFYNFYIENYKNIYFLPDWLSEFIQIRLNICLDITSLEMMREIIFVALVIYSQVVVLRIALAWLIFLNPYTFPWVYIVAAVDWTEDVFQGIIPAVYGVNLTTTIFLGVIGILGDTLNHVVFTMPFLPSEGEEKKLLINEQLKDVLMFHYFPILWYRHPIPNELREFWYKERPDILEYLQTFYPEVDIQFLPDNMIL
jgi:hypothetical protein